MLTIPYSKTTIDAHMEEVDFILTAAKALFERLHRYRSVNNTLERLFSLVLDEVTLGYSPMPNTRACYIERRVIVYMQNYISFGISVHTYNHRFKPYLRSYLILKHSMAPTK